MKPTENPVSNVMSQSFEVVVDISVGENSENVPFERVKEEGDCFLEEVNEYRAEKT